MNASQLHRPKHIGFSLKFASCQVKVKWVYVAPSRETSKALRHVSQCYLQITHACRYFVSVHQMALFLTGDGVRLIAAYCSSVDLERMKG